MRVTPHHVNGNGEFLYFPAVQRCMPLRDQNDDGALTLHVASWQALEEVLLETAYG